MHDVDNEWLTDQCRESHFYCLGRPWKSATSFEQYISQVFPGRQCYKISQITGFLMDMGTRARVRPTAVLGKLSDSCELEAAWESTADGENVSIRGQADALSNPRLDSADLWLSDLYMLDEKTGR